MSSCHMFWLIYTLGILVIVQSKYLQFINNEKHSRPATRNDQDANILHQLIKTILMLIKSGEIETV